MKQENRVTRQSSSFWQAFQAKDFAEAQKQLAGLGEADQQALLAELYQKSEYHRQPVMVSVLRGEIHEGKSFEDFYQAWLPSEEMRDQQTVHGQMYQHHFPVPVRVMNAVNIHNPNDVVSIGMTWVSSKEEEQALWESVNKTEQGKNENNEARHDKIEGVADRELLGLFKVESDDNLGTPF